MTIHWTPNSSHRNGLTGKFSTADQLNRKPVLISLDEHRRRAEERVLDVAELTKPTWKQITNREYDSWERDRLPHHRPRNLRSNGLIRPENGSRITESVNQRHEFKGSHVGKPQR